VEDPPPDHQDEEAAYPLALEEEAAMPDRVVGVVVQCLELGVPWVEDGAVVEAFQEDRPLGELGLVLPADQ
jgi:hypothetical protein